MKREMTTWNIFELMFWLEKCVSRIHRRMFIVTRYFLNDAQKLVDCGISGLIKLG